MENPLKYSDLLVPDNSIENAIKQLEELNKQYDATLKKVRAEAKQVQSDMQQLSGARADNQEKIKQAAAEAARLAKEEANVKKAQAQAELALQKVKTEQLRQEKMLNQQKKNNKITTKEALELADKEVHSINEANEANRRLRIAVRQLTDAEDKEGKIRAKLNSQIQINTNYIRRNSDATIRQKMNIGNYTESIKQAYIELKNGNNSMKNMGIIAKGFGNILRTEVAGGLRQVGTGVGTMIKGFVGAQLVMRGIDTAVRAFKDGLGTIIDFQAANSKLAAILGTTAKGITELTDDAKRLGAATSFTSAQVTSLQTELAKLGFTQKEILQSTQAILNFALAVDADLGSAAQVAGAALRAFGADASEMNKYVSVMAVATTKSALSFSDLESSLSTIAPVAKAFGFTIEDTVTLFGALKNAGFDASSAATATRNILLNLADANGKLARTLGKPVTNMEELAGSFAKLRDKGIDLATTLELTDKRSVAAFNAFLTQADSLVSLRNSVTDVEAELQGMADTMGDNVAGSIKKAQSAWEGLVLTFSNSTGAIKKGIDFFAAAISKINFWLKDTAGQNKQLEQEAIAATDAQMTQYKVISNTLKNLTSDFEANKEAGMKADEASLAAKEEHTKRLQKELDKYNQMYENEQKEQLRLQDEYANKSFWKQGLGLQKSNKQFEDAIEKQGKYMAAIAAERYKIQAKLNAIEKADLVKKPVALTGGGVKVPKIDQEQANANKANLAITKQYEEAKNSVIKDSLQRQREILLSSYNVQVADLMNKYNTDKNLTAESRENIMQIILFKAEKLQQELDALNIKGQQEELKRQQETLQLKLATTEQNSEAELNYKLQILENQRKQELLANNQLAADKQQSEADIYAKYQKQKTDLENKFYKEQALMQFDNQQALAQSEFDLLESTEGEKTRFRLQAEKERLQKLLELNQKFGNKLSDEEVRTMQNTIAKIDKEMEASSKGERKDIYDIVGLKLKDDQKQAISESVGFSIDQLQSILDAQVRIKEQALQNAQEEVEAAQSKVDKEIEARNNGYANDVATAQKELELAKQKEEKAMREKQKAQKQQQALDALTQTSSLITASAEIWKSLAGIPIIGYALAIGAIATMWGSFAASKIKAKEAAKVEFGEGGLEFLEGGSHQSGNDIDMGTKADGTKRRAEGGETFAIINKRNTRKYRHELPGIIKSINNGTFEKKYLNAFGTDGVQINVSGASFDSKKLEKDVQEIKEQGQRRYITDSRGRTVEIYKNLTRTLN